MGAERHPDALADQGAALLVNHMAVGQSLTQRILDRFGRSLDTFARPENIDAVDLVQIVDLLDRIGRSPWHELGLAHSQSAALEAQQLLNTRVGIGGA